MAGKPIPVPEDAVWFYVEGGLSCSQVGAMYNVSESTAQRWMHAAGVIRTDDQKKGRPLGDKCGRGHDLSKWRRRRGGTGDTYCLMCKRERGRENYAARKAQQDMEPQRYGRESGTFTKPHPVEPGACRTCGAYPPCEPPSKEN